MEKENVKRVKGGQMKRNRVIKAWCFRFKDTKELEPWSDRGGMSHTRWQEGWGIFGTKKDLIDNAGYIPEGLEPIKIKLTYLI